MSARLYYLDAYHAGDSGFVAELGGYIRSRSEPACILIDPHDRLLLALESAGPVEPDAPGMDAGSDQAVVDLANTRSNRVFAIRLVVEATRSIVAMLTDAQVAAVAIQGSDRGLIVASADQDRIETGDLKWLLELAGRGVVPVLSSLARIANDKSITYIKPDKVLQYISLYMSKLDCSTVLFASVPGGQTHGRLVDSLRAAVAEPVVLTREDLRAARVS